ncbi:MAG: hypothetical protein ACKVPJ_11080 [Chitinophagales bacterium]
MKSSVKQLYYRLIALWAVCEGVLGGIIHGFNLPISGLIVGGAAVIVISMIGFYVPHKGAILKATVLVCIFKLMLSPHSPLPAYIAVFFQGIMGEFFFLVLPSILKTSTTKIFKLSCILFATIALFESGIQRIITLTLIYGKNFWTAIDSFISGLTGEKEITNYSYYLVGGYVLLHLLAGFFIGIFSGRIPGRIKNWEKDFADVVSKSNDVVAQVQGKKKTGWKLSFIVIWIFLVGLFLQSVLGIGKPLMEEGTILNIIIRSVLILFTWYFFISPLLTYFLKRWLEKQKMKQESTVNEILLLIPSTKNLLERSWKISSDKKGFLKLNKFFKIVLVNSLDNRYDK